MEQMVRDLASAKTKPVVPKEVRRFEDVIAEEEK